MAKKLLTVAAVTAMATTLALTGCGQEEASKPGASPTKPPTAEIVVSVDDMHCEACVKAITDKLQKLPGVAQVEVSLESKTARAAVEVGTGPTLEQILEAVKALGYERVTPGGRSATATAPATTSHPATSVRTTPAGPTAAR